MSAPVGLPADSNHPPDGIRQDSTSAEKFESLDLEAGENASSSAPVPNTSPSHSTSIGTRVDKPTAAPNTKLDGGGFAVSAGGSLKPTSNQGPTRVPVDVLTTKKEQNLGDKESLAQIHLPSPPSYKSTRSTSIKIPTANGDPRLPEDSLPRMRHLEHPPSSPAGHQPNAMTGGNTQSTGLPYVPPPSLLAPTPLAEPKRNAWEDTKLEGEPVIKDADKWQKDTAKTAFCKTCSRKVRQWSWKCQDCGQRVCSTCLTPGNERSEYDQKAARNHLAEKCWCKWKYLGAHIDFIPYVDDVQTPSPGGKNANPKEILNESKDIQARKVAKAEPSAQKKKNLAIARALAAEDIAKAKALAAKTEAANVEGFLQPKKTLSTPNKLGPKAEVFMELDGRDDGEYQDPAKTGSTLGRGPSRRKRGPEEYWEAPDAEDDVLLTKPSKRAVKAAEDLEAAMDEDGHRDGDYQDSAVTGILPGRTRSKRKRVHIDYSDAQDGDDEVLLDDANPKAKRSRYIALKVSSQKLQEILTSPKKSATKPLILAPHFQLHESGTVILGAGVLGLFVALTLAEDMDRRGMQHHIVVVDARSGPSRLASGHCHGFLTTADMPENWVSLAEDATLLWLTILKSSIVRASLGYDNATPFDVVGERGIDDVPRPTWLTSGGHISTKNDGKAVGRIDPTKLATWLRQECESLGVVFVFKSTVSKVQFGTESELKRVRIQSVGTGDAGKDTASAGDTALDNSVREIPCDNLVLAAGPFTTSILTQLVGELPVRLSNWVQSSHWMIVDCPMDLPDVDHVGLRITDAAKTDPKLMDHMTVVARPAEKTIRVAAYSNRIKPDQIDPLQSRGAHVRELKMLATPYLNLKGVQGAHERYERAVGRSELSVGRDGAPVIDRLPSSAIYGPIEGRNEDCKPGGIFLCYGFGRYGTMLAPAAARELVTRMGPHDRTEFKRQVFRIPPMSQQQE